MQPIKHYVFPLLDFSKVDISSFSTIEDRIAASVVKATGISWEKIKSKSRRKEVKDARHIYNYLMRKRTSRTLQYIADKTGRNHSSIINSCKVIKDYLDTEEEFKELIKLVNYYISIYGYKPKEAESDTL